MATTSIDLANRVLGCVSAAGVEFAILHGEGRLSAGGVASDVDLVASLPPAELMRRARPHLREQDLTTVMVWPYDVGSASVFVVDRHARDGAQLDIVSDPLGLGFYGVKTDAILENATVGSKWPTARPEHELLYLIRKRIEKGQAEELAELLRTAEGHPSDDLKRIAEHVFAPSAVEQIMAAIETREATAASSWRFRRGVAETRRLVGRISRPTGRWITVDGPNADGVAYAISRRLGRIIPIARSESTTGTSSKAVAELRSIMSVRLRAGVIATWGRRPPMFRPDIELASTVRLDADEALEQVVAALGDAVDS